MLDICCREKTTEYYKQVTKMNANKEIHSSCWYPARWKNQIIQYPVSKLKYDLFQLISIEIVPLLG
jgi:hypothetical protein